MSEEYVALLLCCNCNTPLNHAQKYCASGVCSFCAASASNDFYVKTYTRIAIKTVTKKSLGWWVDIEYRWKDTGEIFEYPGDI